MTSEAMQRRMYYALMVVAACAIYALAWKVGLHIDRAITALWVRPECMR